MKEKLIRAAALLFALLLPVLSAAACHKQTTQPAKTEEPATNSSPSAPAGEVFVLTGAEGVAVEQNDHYYDLYVANDVTVLQMTKLVKVAEGIAWMIATDISMQAQIPNKIVSLNEGDNIFYVFCHNSDDSIMENYVLNIHRSGSFLVSFEGLEETQSVPSGGYAQVPANTPEKEGFDFDGWNFNFNSPISASVKVLAKWRPRTYTVTLNPSQGTVSVTTMTVSYGDEITLPEPEREGYVFADWYYGEQRVTSGVWTIADNVTLIARWASGSYTVTFDPAGGTFEGASVLEVSYGSTVSFPKPVKDGYTFGGWFEGETLVPDGVFEYTRDLNLVAQWNERAATIWFYENGGTKNTYFDTLKFGSDLPTPVRDGYTFGGWFSDEKLTKKVETVSDTVAKLYAWWTEEGKPEEFVYEVYGTAYKVTARVDEASEAVVPAYIGGRKVFDAIPRPNPDAGVTLDADSLTIHVDRTAQLNAAFVPRFEGEDTALTYSSSNPNYASVDQTGLITGVSTGVCAITVSNEATGLSAVCYVVVNETGRTTPSLAFDLRDLTILNGKTVALNYTYIPEYPDDDQTITFSSTDEAVAAVDANGSLTAAGVGQCSVFARDIFGVAAVCTVTVTDSVNVTLVENGGTNGTYTVALTVGSTLPAAERNGFTFGGWFTNEELTAAVTAVPDEDLTVYAWWTEEGKPGEFVYTAQGDGYVVTARVNEDSGAVVPAYIGGKTAVDAIPEPATPPPTPTPVTPTPVTPTPVTPTPVTPTPEDPPEGE